MLNNLLKTIFIALICALSANVNAQKQLEFLYENDLTFNEKVVQAELFFDKQGRGKGTGYKQFIRWKYWAQQSLNDNGKVITEAESICLCNYFPIII